MRPHACQHTAPKRQSCKRCLSRNHGQHPTAHPQGPTSSLPILLHQQARARRTSGSDVGSPVVQTGSGCGVLGVLGGRGGGGCAGCGSGRGNMAGGGVGGVAVVVAPSRVGCNAKTGAGNLNVSASNSHLWAMLQTTPGSRVRLKSWALECAACWMSRHPSRTPDAIRPQARTSAQLCGHAARAGTGEDRAEGADEPPNERSNKVPRGNVAKAEEKYSNIESRTSERSDRFPHANPHTHGAGDIARHVRLHIARGPRNTSGCNALCCAHVVLTMRTACRHTFFSPDPERPRTDMQAERKTPV